MQDLGTLGGSSGQANAINLNGQIVGYALTNNNGVYEAFLYENGLMRGIGNIGGTHSIAWGINDNGQIVGSASTVGNFGVKETFGLLVLIYYGSTN
jgi:probable HAF family extracellular repeat protein